MKITQKQWNLCPKLSQNTEICRYKSMTFDQNSSKINILEALGAVMNSSGLDAKEQLAINTLTMH